MIPNDKVVGRTGRRYSPQARILEAILRGTLLHYPYQQSQVRAHCAGARRRHADHFLIPGSVTFGALTLFSRLGRIILAKIFGPKR